MFSNKYILLYLVLLLPLGYFSDTINFCKSFQKCSECIQHENCEWCEDSVYNETRCDRPSATSKCIIKYNPKNEKTANGVLPLTKEKKGGQIIQFTPQKFKLKLRRNTTQTIEFKYSRAEGYPVDLYYLMDYSNSMRDDLAKVEVLGEQLEVAMKKVTSNFRIGFGTFVDKPVAPYINTAPGKKLKPCNDCVPAYSFKNHLPLSETITDFKKIVKETKISGNQDPAESGFDALLQVAVCDDIKWLEESRKIVVLATDNTFHSAGDGRLAGIFTPNDGECHLDSSGTYTHAELLDYPSVPQINQKVKNKSINVIFATTKVTTRLYQVLSERIQGSSVAVLSSDSSNIVNIVMDSYNSMSTSIEIKDSSSENLNVVYYSKCTGTNWVQTNKCTNVTIGQEIEFKVEITIINCFEKNENFMIYGVGVKEDIQIEVEPLCKCPCENNVIPKAKDCGNNGNLSCGICDCENKYSGNQCQCSTDDTSKLRDSTLKELCKQPGTSTTCNNRGDCDCGTCTCSKNYYGRYCECDNFSCPRENGLLCGGHGNCTCGVCKCFSGFHGDACDCRTVKNCDNPDTGEECSNNGECICGSCRCKETAEGSYAGDYCEYCPKCPKRCQEFKKCVLCKAHKKGCPNDCEHEVILIEDFSAQNILNKCSIYEDECLYEYGYVEKIDKKVTITAAKTPICFGKMYEYGIYSTVGVILGIVVIGLGTLIIWKVITKIHDKREFDNFMKNTEAKKGLVENKIYDPTAGGSN